MINNWFFSDNAEVIGPFTLSDAKLHVTENPNVYGWHPTFIHWKPVSCIDEFSRVLPPAAQGSTIQKDISDQFIAKQAALENRLTTIGSGIKNTDLSLENLNEKIGQYKLLTKGLSLEVKDAFNNIESKYTNLKRHLSQIKETVDVANNETLAAVDDFNQRINSGFVAMPSINPHATQKPNESKKSTFDNTVDKFKLMEEKLSEVYQPKNTASQEELESKYLESRHLESKYSVSDYLKLSKKLKLQKNSKPQQFYRGVPVETQGKVEGKKNKFEPQKMYRGVPILEA